MQQGFQPVQRRDDAMRLLEASQPRLPGKGDAVIGRGDAVRHQLPVGLQHRHVERKHRLGARHDLPFEGIAMDIDDAGQDQAIPRIDGEAL